jgi:hypothetical protein
MPTRYRVSELMPFLIFIISIYCKCIVNVSNLVRATHRPNFGPVWFLAWPRGGQKLIWFDLLFKVTGVKVQNILQSLIVLLLFVFECSNFVRTSWFVLLLFDLECSSFVLINHPTLHLFITHATIPMSQHLNPRWPHGPWTISFYMLTPFPIIFCRKIPIFVDFLGISE